MTNGSIEANGQIPNFATSVTSGVPIVFTATNAFPETYAQIFCAVVCNSFNDLSIF